MLKEYQEFCKQGHSPAIAGNPLYYTTGLAGETGEVCELVKKSARDSILIDTKALIKELGDVLWYLTNIASIYGITLQEIIDGNIAKLKARHGSNGEYIPHMSDSETGGK